MKVEEFQGKYRFLSNFYPCKIVFEGKIYNSVEHAFQASKTLIEDERERIRLTDSPGRAKKIGRTVALRSDWEKIKLDIMKGLIKLKFICSPLRTMLLQTESCELIEGNYWGDTFWGVCNNVGENNLGKIIMEIRTELQDDYTLYEMP